MSRKVGELARRINAKLYGDAEMTVLDVTHDSRQAREGYIFVAIRGLTVDGNRFVSDVMRRGAVGVISELEPPVGFQGVWLQVKNARIALAEAADFIHYSPSRGLKLVGITGTNGKTTTTYLMFALGEANGEKSAMITTVEYRIGDETMTAVRTTPEASDTQRFLRRALEAGCKLAAMEASSQALHLHRCNELAFKVAIFTNLTRDHLDYHKTMENYFDAKKMLFDGRIGTIPEACVINTDDEWGRRLISELQQKGQKCVTFAIETEGADFSANEINVSLLSGTKFLMKTPKGVFSVSSPLIGKPHVYNILAATAAAIELGYDIEACIKGIEGCFGAPGRFERVPCDVDFAVIVDYAHTDDALLNTLKTARELAQGRVITVFGCGGDRDRSKRAPMGAVAGKYSDLVIITSDNPRTEDPLKIISEIEEGIKTTSCPYLKISDRREAIYAAIQKAKKNDVVIIAGKGHETYQIIGNEKYFFDDREVARQAIETIKEIAY
ncbi:MAG: UDP-N-acetylmuramoyl-L-alanyl-D-glutamate--2,6-diaminopimelate ligase [Pyrinomonadaceae bacterium]|nr:UDP-N-acetylmuramoyl-L-alanyl-D-glutamate--2,6-diaminopimelate ligase [Pyrinomonadaceae bacterium]MCX7639803.1 UDP-N-acetylmuramoyl-L-alanyl-D-glutamate--2,6-diaminopimelate ligase [Pyrinomonadaceae bacterium]MDW8304386.1 UDP-N-acetylmuramoyl-L-alanyl-D-glutamate--2,6-diaminopimelate ligase [Acidobacteriota bacterium]